jgi:fatty acid-binding protein DegV
MEPVLRHFARTNAEENLLTIFRELDERDQEVVVLLTDKLLSRTLNIRRRIKKA